MYGFHVEFDRFFSGGIRWGVEVCGVVIVVIKYGLFFMSGVVLVLSQFV